MQYKSWTDLDNTGLGVCVVLTEIDSNGYASCEIGLNDARSVVHKCPSSSYPLGERGYFDNLQVEIFGLRSGISAETFQEYWDSK